MIPGQGTRFLLPWRKALVCAQCLCVESTITSPITLSDVVRDAFNPQGRSRRMQRDRAKTDQGLVQGHLVSTWPRVDLHPGPECRVSPSRFTTASRNPRTFGEPSQVSGPMDAVFREAHGFCPRPLGGAGGDPPRRLTLATAHGVRPGFALPSFFVGAIPFPLSGRRPFAPGQPLARARGAAQTWKSRGRATEDRSGPW